MFAYDEDENAYSVATRTAARREKPRPTYSPRFEGKRGKSATSTNGVHRRRNKRSGL